MYKFGKIPPREIESSGVAGLLSKDCHVFYDTLFNPNAIGRVSDLLSARLKVERLDDLGLRALLLFSFYEAYRTQSQGGYLNGSLVLECGMDEEKVAIGISFTSKDQALFKTDGLAERLAQSKPGNEFENVLWMIYLSSDHAVLRINAALGRIEVISLLAIPEKMEKPEKQPLTIIDLKAHKEPVEAKEYTQLADLDFNELLNRKGGGDSTERKLPSSGVVLAQKFSSTAQSNSSSEKVTISAGQKPDDQGSGDVRVSGAGNESTGSALKEDFIVVKGGKAVDVGSTDIMRVSHPSGQHLVAQEEQSNKAAAFHVAAGKNLDAQQTESPAVDKQGFASSVQAVFGKVWPFRKKVEAENSANTQGSQASHANGTGQVADVAHAPEAAKPTTAKSDQNIEVSAAGDEINHPAAVDIPEFDDNDLKGMAGYLSSSFSSGSFGKLVENAHQFARDVKKEPADSPVRRWVESFAQDIIAEKIRLVEVSKKFTKSIRQKELELTHREQQFAEDLRRKDEAIHQKNAALNHAKEQLTQLSSQITRLKAGKGPGEEGNFEQKYHLSQRMISSLRDENAKLAAKLEESKAQASGAQKAADSSAQVELANIKSKYDQMVRQNMQLKGVNEQLTRRIQQVSAKNEKNDRGAANSEELKKKLEIAIKLSDHQKKELEALKARMELANKEQTRLTREVHKKELELKNAKRELETAQKALGSTKKAG
jgi:hypothetical protein